MQRVAFVEVHGQGAGRPRIGHQGGELLVLGVVDDRVADRPVLRLPNKLHGSLLWQRGEDRAYIGSQVGPDGQKGTRTEAGAVHWQHPSFLGYYPTQTSPASVVGELLASGLAVQHMMMAPTH